MRQDVAVTLDRSRQLWRGNIFDDLAEFNRHFKAGGYSVATVVESRCAECDGRAFRVDIVDENAIRRICLAAVPSPSSETAPTTGMKTITTCAHAMRQ
jgi:hypothetical protein